MMIIGTSGTVEVFGLSGARDMNGQIGEIVGFNKEKQRAEVVFGDAPGKLVRRENLRPVGAAAGENLCVVGLCAVHLTEESHLVALENCLRSIRQQASPLDLFLLGWSAENELLRESASTRLKEWAATKLLLDFETTVAADESLSPFQHFRRLLADSRLRDLFVSEKPVWVIFTYADDLWHHDRVATYREVINAQATLPGFSDVRANQHGQLCGGGLSAMRATSVFEADLMLQQGSATCLDANDADSQPELFHFALRLDLVDRFFKWVGVHEKILQSPFCDEAFVRFLKLQKGEQVFFDPACWMYFCNRPLCDSDGAPMPRGSNCWRPSAQDEEMAAQAVQAGLLQSAQGCSAAWDVCCARRYLEHHLIQEHLGCPITGATVAELARSMAADLERLNGCSIQPAFVAGILRDICSAFGIEEQD